MLVPNRYYNHRQTGITTQNLPFGAGTALAGETVIGIQVRDSGTTLFGGENSEIVPKEVFDAMFLDLYSTKQGVDGKAKSGKMGEIPFRLMVDMTKIHGFYPINHAVLDLSQCKILSSVVSAKSVEMIFLIK